MENDISGEITCGVIYIDAVAGVKLQLHAAGRAPLHPVDDFLRGRFVVPTVATDKNCDLVAKHLNYL
eukprot:802513-Pyramimonas_sp.AAC.1